MMLVGGAATTGAISKRLTVLPTGETVATGSACILDAALRVGGTDTVGSTCVLVPESTGCTICSLSKVFPGPVCTIPCG